ncbi:unnamed protein product [Wuchereria bancrofti]|uniref:Uncharacterized protein n=1 Tax=Wuchereria bancrofti TaxID=6293 RepID=A0A3P7FLZ9_WUCBA|nr:unnamed protein product [Wuchereria bancrofti]
MNCFSCSSLRRNSMTGVMLTRRKSSIVIQQQQQLQQQQQQLQQHQQQLQQLQISVGTERGVTNDSVAVLSEMLNIDSSASKQHTNGTEPTQDLFSDDAMGQ